MTIRTPLCDMLGIEYPIMLAGMGGVSYARTRRGGVERGRLRHARHGGALAGRDQATRSRRSRDLTDKPFGVDLLAAVPESLERTADHHHRRRREGVHLRASACRRRIW